MPAPRVETRRTVTEERAFQAIENRSRMSLMNERVTGPIALGTCALFTLLSTGCAEVYVPRPSGAVTITSNGGNGYRVFKNGEDMGSDWSVGDAVAGDARAESEADKASGERVGSIISGIGGAVAVGVGAGLLSYDGYQSGSNGTFSNGMADAGIGLLVGGIVLYIVSGALSGAAHTHMFNAVNMYNDDLAARGGARPVLVQAPPRVHLPPAVLVSPGPGYAPVPAAPPLYAPGEPALIPTQPGGAPSQ
jgi:hypothetical protein